MKTKMFYSFCVVAFSVALFSFDLPKGWIAAGSDPAKYEMGVDPGAGQDGKNAATIKSIEPGIKGFGTLMQNCEPGEWKGKRVRMTGSIKSKDVTDWAAFWFRIDSATGTGMLGFDNMQNRAIKGTTDWMTYSIVLDIPEGASNLAYGALISETGQIWFDRITFEVVDNSVPVTNMNPEKKEFLLRPTNLSFED